MTETTTTTTTMTTTMTTMTTASPKVASLVRMFQPLSIPLLKGMLVRAEHAESEAPERSERIEALHILLRWRNPLITEGDTRDIWDLALEVSLPTLRRSLRLLETPENEDDDDIQALIERIDEALDLHDSGDAANGRPR